MRFSTLLALAPALVSAANITVTVGGGGLNFEPNTVQAQVDDILIFQFVAKTHSVTQSTFAAPCQKQEGGIDSGIKTVAEGAQGFEQWAFRVQTTDPLWFFCAVGQHCQNGMVFSVNPTAEKTHDAFLAAARAGGTGNSTTPSGSGAPPAATGPASPSGSGAGQSAAPTSAGGSATGSGASPAPSNGALQLAGNAAGLLTALGVIAGLTL